MVKMKHPVTQIPGYFVVFKIDSTKTIHLAPHNDAGRDKEMANGPAREDIKKTGKKTGGLTVSDLQNLGVEDGKPPVKVWISPLGKIKELAGD